MPFRHRALDSGARQPTNREPTNQKTSKATSPQTSKPTNQHSSKPPQQTAGAEMNPQTNQKTIKKSCKNPPKLLQNRSWRLSWAPLGASWGVLGPSWRQDGPKSQKKRLLAKLGNGSWEPKSTKNRSGGLPKSDYFFDWFCGRVLVAFGPNLAPTWPPKPSQNRPKLVPKSIKNWIKMLTNFFLLDF